MGKCFLCLIKPSDVVEAIDTVAELNNLFIDLHQQNIINEIEWLDKNYDNIEAISAYWLNLANFNNVVANISYAEQFRSYSIEKKQYLIELRANLLYCQLKNLDIHKINNKPLKVIAKELKALEK